MTFEEEVAFLRSTEKYVQALEQHFGGRREIAVLGAKGVFEAAVVQIQSPGNRP